MKFLFTPRKKDSHKGDYGHVLLMGGSATKPGAILLAGKAALRTGSGKVTVGLPDKAFRKLSKNFLELMYEPFPSTTSGTFSKQGTKKLKKVLEGKDVVVVGPGMGINADTKAVLSFLLKNSNSPLVLDADALNCISEIGTKRALSFIPQGNHVVLTPHPGEMARLLGTTMKKVQANRIKIARDFSRTHGVHLVLKGFRTIIANPSGKIFVNTTGNPGMATAGMGDLLAGMIGSLIGQGIDFEKSIRLAVYLHGQAGDRVAKRLGDRGLLATDVIEEIPPIS